MRIDESYPTGRVLLKYYAVSRNYDQTNEKEMNETSFSGLFVVPEQSEFFRSIFGTLHSQIYDGGEIVLTMRIIFKIKDFFMMLRRREMIPPKQIPSNDPRASTLANILSSQRDFKIMANDGEIRTSKYLLYLSTNYFHDLITTNPRAASAVLPFDREIIKTVLDFALKGTYDMETEQIDKVRKFLQCVRRIRPLKQAEIINHIAVNLNEILLKKWKNVSLDDAVKMLDIAYEQQFANLLDSAMNLIIDQHFIDFRCRSFLPELTQIYCTFNIFLPSHYCIIQRPDRGNTVYIIEKPQDNIVKLEYNEHSEGENGALFQRLNHSEIADFLAPTNVMLNSYRKRGAVTRILKYKTKTSSKRQFIQ